MAVGISSVKVVPFLLVKILYLEQARMGTTFTVRNPQLYSIAIETTEYHFFRPFIT